MEEVGARIKCFDTWWVKPQEWFYQSCIPWYVDPDVSDALKVIAFIWWSLDNSKDILMYFRRTKNMFCMQKWQMVYCNVLHWLCQIYNWNVISILGYLFRVIRWHNKMEESSMMTWMSSNANIVADTATRAKYIIALEAARELGVVLSMLVLCSSIVRQ
jgi:hypothetical protein